ncbi:MAG: hypothetical protein ACC645_24595, partial [Pirellulales bacterium]
MDFFEGRESVQRVHVENPDAGRFATSDGDVGWLVEVREEPCELLKIVGGDRNVSTCMRHLLV